MSETYKITVPIIRSPTPPNSIIITKMINITAEKVREWTETLKPRFRVFDTIQMAQFKITEKEVKLQYKINRNKKGGI